MSPYSNRPPSSFWRTGVAEQRPESPRDFYRKKFAISRTYKIATAGSCFAQHIANQLRARNYMVLDVEPPPPGLSREIAAKYGYNLFSARYGNIYVVRQLLQLFRESFGVIRLNEPPWEKDGRFYDPFRPNVEPRGFGTPKEVALHRRSHLAAVRRMFRQADLVVFTLGLTEAWVNRQTGIVYPTAPGVIAGEYDPEIHEFKNFRTAEIAEDLRAFRNELKQRNPGAKFLFTVSPVPLTATASDDHVLSATIYSKSVLRAVAGEMAQDFDDVDYFPSYDLIASHWSKGAFYDDNLRTVTNHGVDTAMRMFLTEHDDAGGVGAEVLPITAPKRSPAESLEADENEVVCEDMLLEAFNR